MEKKIQFPFPVQVVATAIAGIEPLEKFAAVAGVVPEQETVTFPVAPGAAPLTWVTPPETA